ncbi:hypothetical protein TNCV_395341 [Trichonephila clavipes]|nr:hypothetical protein TNCV_395341 [Trichonephila clavipes]
MYHDKIPERCKLNFTGIVDDALRIAGELFPKQTLKKYIRKEVEIDTDGRVRSRRFEKKKEKSLKEGAGNETTSELPKVRGFSERILDAEFDVPGLRKERRERWPSRDPPPVVHKRHALVTLNTHIPETIVKIKCQ